MLHSLFSVLAVVRILDKNAETGDTQLRTAAVMKKGTSFGVRTFIPQSHYCLRLLATACDHFATTRKGMVPKKSQDGRKWL